MAKVLVYNFFRGEAPKFNPRLLPKGYAQLAKNCRLFDGKLKPWNGMTEVALPFKTGEIKAIYPMRDGSGNLVWLEWTEDVNVASGLLAGDTTQRICFTGYGTPKTTNYAMATSGTPKPADWWRLGVPAPISAPSVSSGGGGTGVARDRAYVVTFVHQWADGLVQEGQPSRPSNIISAKSGETINLSNIPRWVVNVSSITRSGNTATVTIPSGYKDWFGDKDRVTIAGANQPEYNGVKEITRVSDTQFTYTVSGNPTSPATGTITAKTNHNITAKRIYRTVVGNSGTFYYFVAEVPETTTSYADNATDTALVLAGTRLETADWDMPPRDMTAIINMGNGILAGISGNQVCFSEPYYPHAWPKKYRRTLHAQAVGLGVIGTTLVVGTKGHPVVYSGTHPAGMAENKLSKINHPCISGRGLANLGFAVLYPSKEGLVAITEGGSSVATVNYYDKDSWANVYPDTMRAFQFADRYVGCFTSGQDAQGNMLGGAIIVDRENNIGGLASLDLYISAGHYDQQTGDLYVVHEGKIKKWDEDLVNKMSMEWAGPEEVLEKPTNFGAARLECEFSLTAEEIAAIQAAYNAVISYNTGLISSGGSKGAFNAAPFNVMFFNGSLLKTPPGTVDTQSITFQLYADRVLKFTKSMNADIGVFRLPSGYKAKTVEVRISGNAIVHRCLLGETPASLEGV